MKHLMHSGRRAFLMGAGGAALALPLLELTHGKAWSQNNVTKRFLTVFSHGGTITDQSHSSLHDGTGKYLSLNHWKPADPGEALQLGAIHQDLESFKDKLMVIQGVDNMAGGVQAQYGSGGHDISNVTSLTAADATDPWGEPSAQGASIDRVIADRLAATQPVKFKRIHLNVKGHQYGSPYFAAAGQRVSGESSPLAAFNTIFEGVSPDSEPDPAFLHQQALRRSVVDGVLDGYNDFRSKVSQADRHRIDAHIEHLYALEAELNAAPVVCAPPTGISEDENAGGNIVGPLHVKIILAALRCGLTNVANLEIADIIASWTPNGGLIDSAFEIGHSLGHYQRELGPQGESSSLASDWEIEMLENRQWRFSLVKQLLEGLDDPTFLEGGGTMLDNSVLYYTSEFSEPASHVSAGQLVFLAGSGGGYFNTGRHLNFNTHAASDPNTRQYATNESTHNLYTSFLHAMGESDSHFGSDHATHQGPLPGLTA
jgi:Protein of unknown function (DUF1552)